MADLPGYEPAKNKVDDSKKGKTTKPLFDIVEATDTDEDIETYFINRKE